MSVLLLLFSLMFQSFRFAVVVVGAVLAAASLFVAFRFPVDKLLS